MKKRRQLRRKGKRLWGRFRAAIKKPGKKKEKKPQKKNRVDLRKQKKKKGGRHLEGKNGSTKTTQRGAPAGPQVE